MNEFELVDAYTQLSLRGRSEYERGLKSLEGRLRSTEAYFERVGRKAQWMLVGMGAGLGYSVKLAGDAAETASKFEAVFGDQADAATKFADELSESMERSVDQIQESMSAYQAFFAGLDFGGEQSLKMSQTLQQLTLDFASFHNIVEEESLERFISGMSGSSEVFARFGINLKEGVLKMKLHEMGMEANLQKATEQQKAIARLAIIYESMVRQDAVGDLTRTHTSLNNQLKALQANFHDAVVELGTRFVPVVTVLVSKLKALTEWLKNADESQMESIANWIAYAAAIAGVLFILPKLIATIRILIGLFRALAMSEAIAQAMAGPAGWAAVAAGLVAATAGVVALNKAFDQWVEGGLRSAKRQAAEWASGMEEETARVQEAMEERYRDIMANANKMAEDSRAPWERLADNIIDSHEKAEKVIEELTEKVRTLGLTAQELELWKLEEMKLPEFAPGVMEVIYALYDFLEAKERWGELRKEHAQLLEKQPKWKPERMRFETVTAASLQARVQASISQAEDKRLEYQKESRDHLKNIEKIEGEMLEVGKKIYKKDSPEPTFL